MQKIAVPVGAFIQQSLKIFNAACYLLLSFASLAQTPPNKIPPPPVFEPALTTPAPSPVSKINCGTHWTGWYKPIDPKTNPCPLGCEPGTKLKESRHQQDQTTWIDTQYQCYGIPTARMGGLENKPIREARLSGNAVGTLTPDSGKWHSFVRIKGTNFAKAEHVTVIWYPNDDDTQTLAGKLTATLRQYIGNDEIEIEIPRDAGGSNGGVVRIYLSMPNQLQPVLAGRFTINMTTEPAAETLSTTPILITTPPLIMKGRRPPPEILPSAPILITTSPLIMKGKRPAPEVLPTTPILITTPPLIMKGKRLSLYDAPPLKQRPIIDRTLRTLP